MQLEYWGPIKLCIRNITFASFATAMVAVLKKPAQVSIKREIKNKIFTVNLLIGSTYFIDFICLRRG